MTREDVESLGYRNVRQLPDGARAGTVELIFTRAICTGINWISYAHRWCLEDRGLAVSELNKMENMDDWPQGWVARR